MALPGDFLEQLAATDWFSATGRQFVPAVRTTARRYLEGLGLSTDEILPALDWNTARTITQRNDWATHWWQAEEAERLVLLKAATGIHGHDEMHTELASAGSATADTVSKRSEAALDRAGLKDPALFRCAAGAASQAIYHAGLAVLAGASPDHPFLHKLQMFRIGHWPLGLYGRSYMVL